MPFKNLLLAIFLFIEFLLSPAVLAGNKAPVSVPTSSAIEKRLTDIERLLNNHGLLEMLQQLERLQQETAKLRGKVEVNNHLLVKMKDRQRDLYTDLDRRLQSITTTVTGSPSLVTNTVNNNPPLETLHQVETISPPQNQNQTETVTLAPEQANTQTPDHLRTSEPAKAVESNTVQIQAEYQQAFKLLKQSQYDQAIKAFGAFLKAHPHNQYSDNSQYWMAETLYVKRQYKDAIREYKYLLANYPNSPKVSHGFLKIGFSYQELGMVDEAKLWYNNVKKRFPGTTASRLASDRLKHINGS